MWNFWTLTSFEIRFGLRLGLEHGIVIGMGMDMGVEDYDDGNDDVDVDDDVDVNKKLDLDAIRELGLVVGHEHGLTVVLSINSSLNKYILFHFQMHYKGKKLFFLTSFN